MHWNTHQDYTDSDYCKNYAIAFHKIQWKDRTWTTEESIRFSS